MYFHVTSYYYVPGQLLIEKIKSPPKIKKRGRPKGHETTVVGLPKKRLKLKDRLIPFLKKHWKDRDKGNIMK